MRLAAARAYLDFLNGGPPAEESPPHIHASADRRLFAQLLRGMVRHKRLLEAELARLTDRPPAQQHPALTTIALLGLYQLRFLERVPPHAAVYETVGLARPLGQGRAGGWVNAILRRAQREREESAAWLAAQPVAVRTSHPDWMARRWHTQYGGKETERICEANNLGGGATLRVEQGRISPGDLIRALADEEIAATPHPLLPGALRVEQAGALLRSHSFREGLCYVQDIASQLLLAWMAPLLKGRVLDACAAPGGKLTWLAGLRRAHLSVLGADIAPGRLRMVRENFTRMRLPPPTLLRADAARLPFGDGALDDAAGGGLDGILLDVPCSATGMIRKYPELKWRKQESDLPAYVALQKKLMWEAARVVRPGGWLLYITCSLEAEENEHNVAAFLEAHANFRRRRFGDLAQPKKLGEPPRSFITRTGDFRVLPAADRMGLYAALLEKGENARTEPGETTLSPLIPR